MEFKYAHDSVEPQNSLMTGAYAGSKSMRNYYSLYGDNGTASSRPTQSQHKTNETTIQDTAKEAFSEIEEELRGQRPPSKWTYGVKQWAAPSEAVSLLVWAEYPQDGTAVTGKAHKELGLVLAGVNNQETALAQQAKTDLESSPG
jgi:hypothetical protein